MRAPAKWTCGLIATLTLAAGAPAWAVVAGVGSAVVDLETDGGAISAVTVGGTLYADLTLPVSATADAIRTAWNSAGGSDPVDASTAIGNPVITDGLLNTNATVQFGRSIGLGELLIFMDIESAPLAETVTFLPVDGAGNPIGDYSLTLSDDGGGKATEYGPSLLPGTYNLKVVDVADPIANFNVRGVSFTLGDLTGTTGDLALAQGFRVEDNFSGVNVDPAFAAIAEVLPPNTDFVAPAGTGVEDFNVLRSNYLESGLSHSDGDANGDGLVNHVDYFLWRTDFLSAGGSLEGISLPVPEPTAACLLVAGSLAALWRGARAA